MAHAFSLGAEQVSLLLGNFGQHLYDTGGAVTTLTHAILAVVDARRAWRRHLAVAWDIIASWKELAPSKSHVPLPFLLLRACVAVAACRGQLDWALPLLAGFAGMLRPAEISRLSLADFVIAEDLGNGLGEDCFVRIVNPKMRRLGFRRQHVKLREPLVVRLVQALRRTRPAASPLVQGPAARFNGILLALLERFQIPFADGVGITWASLRAGGAMHRNQTGQHVWTHVAR